MPTLSLVINTYNNPAALHRVLEALANGSMPPGQAVIADDGSDERTRACVNTWRTLVDWPITHVWQPKQGYRRSRILNRAILAATGDYLVFIDGDCIPQRHFVRDHTALAEEGTFVQGRRAFVEEKAVPQILDGLTTPTALIPRGQVSGIFKAFRFPWPHIRRDRDLHGILGCNLGIWRDDLEAVNGYDEAYEGWGAEDSDLAARLYHLGRERKQVHGRAILFHLNHPKLARDRYDDNKAKLRQTLEQKTIRCDQGLDRHDHSDAGL